MNTSPLVFLGHLGRLELLRHEGREVYIPQAVAEAIAEKSDVDLLQEASGSFYQQLLNHDNHQLRPLFFA